MAAWWTINSHPPMYDVASLTTVKVAGLRRVLTHAQPF